MKMRFLWVILVGFAFSKGACSLGTNQTTIIPTEAHTPSSAVTTISSLNITQLNGTTTQNTSQSEVSPHDSTNDNEEIKEIFHGRSNISTIVTDVNSTVIIRCWNTTSGDFKCGPVSNDTLKTNYTTVAEAIASNDVSNFRLPKHAAIAAGVCLFVAVVGYMTCVGYRRFLQRKYGDSQMLTKEDFYDTSDLRYFEI